MNDSPSVRDRVRTRLGRLRPDLLSAPIRGWFIVSALVSLGLAAVILIPGLTDAVTAEGEGAIAEFSAPPAFRLAVVAAVGVLAGASVVWVLLRERVLHPPARRDAVLRLVLTAAVALFPAFALAADRSWVRAAIALLLGIAAIVVAQGVRSRATPAGPALAGVVAVLPWLTLVEYQSTAEGSDSGSWIWVALFGVAAAFAAFGSYYGVARAAESRSSRLGFLYRSNLRPPIVLLVVALASVLVVLRLTIARELFPDPDPQLWSPFGRSAISWGIAALVAALLVIVAVRASRKPLTRFGERRVIASLATLGNLDLVISVVVILLGMAVAVATGSTFLPADWVALLPALKLGGVLLLGLVVLLPAFRGTAARWIGLITALFLIPGQLSNLLAASGVELTGALDGFPATPVQVLLLVIAAAVVLAVANLARPATRVDSSLVTRLAIVPLVAVHAGWLLPAVWSDLGRWVLVIGVLVALLWLMPPVAADRARHAATVLGASTAQLAALVVFVLAIPSLFQEGNLVVLGLLWLAIPIMAALMIDATERAADQ